MNFEWDLETQQLYDSILKQTAQWPRGTDGFYTREQWQRCADLGLLGLPLPRAHGGSGLGALATARAIEAFGRGYADMGLVFGTSAHLLACAVPVAEFGTPEIKASVLPRLHGGDWIAGNAITEEQAGSDVHALEARATRDGDHYVLDGVKTFVSNGPIADVFVVYAKTNPAFGHLGISVFVVERDRPGVVVGEPMDKDSLRNCPAGTVTFEGCRVPANHRLGEEGMGAAIFAHSMRWERTCLMAGYLGATERLLEQCIAHVSTRQQFGRPLAVNQAISHRLVDVKLALESARLLLWRACWLIDEGRPDVMYASLAKLAISEVALRTALDAVHLAGAGGIRSDSEAAAALRDAVPSTIFSGTSEMQRELVAKGMGL
ncbi:MAG TPA: acyl-CoA dehydrogenase family protein [Haliangium sp.]|nr:acyl-CoA dehydrogenase family protein [Haliangium sp.]